MKKYAALALVFVLCLFAQYTPPAGGAPSGAAGGKLSGTYPNPGLSAACGDLSNAGSACSQNAVNVGTIPIVCTTVSLTAQSAPITATNLLCNAVQAPAGLYRISFYTATTNGQSGSGNIVPSIGWHSESAARTIAIGSYGNGNFSPSSALTAGHELLLDVPFFPVFRHDGTSHITFAIGYTATGKFDAYIMLECLQKD